jgi:branched-chain amino acid transport system substrate-binding protein
MMGACVRRAPPVPSTEPIRLGELASLTGAQAPFGQAAHKGIQLAVEEANLHGGRKVELLTEDDRGEPAEVAGAVERLAAKGALVVLGEVATSLSLAAAPVAQKLRIPMISPGSTHPDVTRQGDYIFRVCFTDPFQGAVLARFALNYLQLRKAAIFLDGSAEYSRGLAEHFSKEYLANGGTIVERGEYLPGEKGLEKKLAPIVAARPDLLFLPGYFTEVGAAASAARKLGFKGVFLGGDGWDGDGLVKGAGKALVGAYFSNHFSAEDRNPEVQSFVARFQARYSETPTALAAVGYDAARVALEAVRRAPESTRPAIRTALASTRNFAGVTGIITMSATRDAMKPAVVLKVREKGQHQYVTTVNP